MSRNELAMGHRAFSLVMFTRKTIVLCSVCSKKGIYAVKFISKQESMKLAHPIFVNAPNHCIPLVFERLILLTNIVAKVS